MTKSNSDPRTIPTDDEETNDGSGNGAWVNLPLILKDSATVDAPTDDGLWGVEIFDAAQVPMIGDRRRDEQQSVVEAYEDELLGVFE